MFDEFGPEFYSRLNEYEQAGFELQLSYTGETDSLHLGYSYVKELERDNSDLVEAVALSSPEQTLSLLYSHRFANDWLGSISLFYVDDLRWNFSAASTVPVSWADLKLARKFKTTNGELDVSLTAQNIFDEEKINLRGRDSGERRILLSAKYSF
ncbi:hypothetical protein BOW52_11035 [Solemya elarraichensis gill symbiont]|uniref:TonB-dependent receptor-like beta-barrel domain-containing protein n=1 Tax=Solemya elarraichensis gill symbiont TaxID=1918949 RepID=A0A1T2KT17_9GAMM|nr:hypothetical protein BOW52_11035 [Solemya elarraichensis gill symbiont]